MTFNFINPLYLCLLPIAILFVIFVSRKKAFKSKMLEAIIITIRSLIFTLLILSLSGITIKRFSNVTTTIFTADISASMKGTSNQIIEFINNSLKYKSSKDSTGMVCFAGSPLIEKAPMEENENYSISTVTNNGFTNISEALNLSRSLFSENVKKRILLLSDGQENIFSSIETAKLLKQQDIIVDVYPIENLIDNELQITSLNVPKYINKESKYNIEVTIDSFINTKTRLIIYKQNSVIFDDDVNIKEGENKFAINDVANIGGNVIYRAEIQPEVDTIYENNIFHGYSYIDDIPSVLVIQKDGSGEEIKRILENSKVNVKLIDSLEAPSKDETINIYNAIIIADVSIDDMPEKFPSVLESYVKNSAGGVLITGGENSFGLGGYKGTELETVLPVEMELKDKENLPDLGLIILIDRSGSMDGGEYGISKLELAKESVIRSVETIKENDSIGIITFDDSFQWTVNFQKLENRQVSITDSISKINSGGGTSILPSLIEAVNTLKNADTKLKHIILLTDGQAEQSGYNTVLDDIKENNITLSTVAIGSDSDKKLLESLAENGNGRYYYTDEFTDLPKLFVKETYMAGRNYINNRTFYPETKDVSSILNGIEQVPYINGYIATTAKDRADVVLVSDEDEPILSTWQYGLGRAAVWTSDISSWAGEWFSTDEGVNIFKNTVSWILRKQELSDISVDIQTKGDKSDIFVNVSQNNNIEYIEGNILGNEKEYDVKFNIVSPEKFKAEIPTSEQGTYIVNLKLNDGNSVNTIGVNIPYSSEFNIKNLKSGSAILNKIAEITGGRIIQEPKDVFYELQDNVYTEKSLSDLFLLFSIIFLIFDIALRRFYFISTVIENIFSKVKLTKTNKYFKSNSSSMYNNNVKENKAKNENKAETVHKNKNEEVKKSSTSSLLVAEKKKRSGR